MKYLYIPETYNYNLLESKFQDYNDFLNIQIMYRQGFEDLLHNYIDFEKIDNYIKSKNVIIPTVDDNNYNFYHMYSHIPSNYLFLRNNIHVENLTIEEIEYIRNNNQLDSKFFNNTYERVLYEEGNEVFYGTPMDENLVNSKSIVFEFAYDQKKCESIEQLKIINETIDEIFALIEKQNKENINMPVSFIKYHMIPDLFYKKDSVENLVL